MEPRKRPFSGIVYHALASSAVNFVLSLTPETAFWMVKLYLMRSTYIKAYSHSKTNDRTPWERVCKSWTWFRRDSRFAVSKWPRDRWRCEMVQNVWFKDRGSDSPLLLLHLLLSEHGLGYITPSNLAIQLNVRISLIRLLYVLYLKTYPSI